jgi:hypothetical protein
VIEVLAQFLFSGFGVDRLDEQTEKLVVSLALLSTPSDNT